VSISNWTVIGPTLGGKVGQEADCVVLTITHAVLTIKIFPLNKYMSVSKSVSHNSGELTSSNVSINMYTRVSVRMRILKSVA
jgi:hypothetical protein